MPSGSELTTVSDVRENRSFLFTATDEYGAEEELLVVPCDEDDRPVRAFANRCTHEAQRLDTGRGVAMRDGQIICPKHGSMFDACSGYCDNGDAADTTDPPRRRPGRRGRRRLPDRRRVHLRPRGRHRRRRRCWSEFDLSHRLQVFIISIDVIDTDEGLEERLAGPAIQR